MVYIFLNPILLSLFNNTTESASGCTQYDILNKNNVLPTYFYLSAYNMLPIYDYDLLYV